MVIKMADDLSRKELLELSDEEYEAYWADFLRRRVTELLQARDLSEHRVSLELGFSKGYLQGITSGKALPKYRKMMRICHYFDLLPGELFEPDIQSPALYGEALRLLEGLPEEKLRVVIEVMKSMQN